METTYNYDSYYGDVPLDAVSALDPFQNHVDATDTYYFLDLEGNNRATKIIQVWSVNNDSYIRFSFRFDDLTWKKAIRIVDAPQSQDLFHSAMAFQVCNVIPGAAAWFQVVGLW